MKLELNLKEYTTVFVTEIEATMKSKDVLVSFSLNHKRKSNTVTTNTILFQNIRPLLNQKLNKGSILHKKKCGKLKVIIQFIFQYYLLS